MSLWSSFTSLFWTTSYFFVSHFYNILIAFTFLPFISISLLFSPVSYIVSLLCYMCYGLKWSLPIFPSFPLCFSVFRFHTNVFGLLAISFLIDFFNYSLIHFVSLENSCISYPPLILLVNVFHFMYPLYNHILFPYCMYLCYICFV